ncbi:MAG: sporulation protein YunB [Clostridia bacterium]|nr:sporulation protein YunB [Clostridia bacterium]
MRLGSRRFIRNRRKASSLLAFFLILSASSAMLYYMFLVVRPTFVALAESKAKELAVVTVNRSVTEQIEKAPITYSDIVTPVLNEENSVTALSSNLVSISKLKSDLNLAIMNDIAGMDVATMHVPLGSLLGSDFFAGLGPKIPFHVMPFGTAETDICTDFTDAGINQTRLTVLVKVKADMSVLLPTVRKKSTVETTVPVLETVIVGAVPDSYTHVDRDGYEFEDDVLELAE